jgi:fatty acid desaturase
MTASNHNLHCSNLLAARGDLRLLAYDEPVSTSRKSVRRPAPSPRQDRIVAMVIWIFTGLLFGLALGVFTGHGWLFLSIGLVVGILLAITRTRATQTIDED